MKPKNCLILVTPFLSSFIENDINILSNEYRVIVNQFNWKKKHLTPIFLIIQFFFFVKYLRKTQKIVIEFGGYWALIPALLGKFFKVPVFIILHGTDCASIPPIRYGSLRKKLIKLFCSLSYKLASALLPVSSSLINVRNTYYTDDKFSDQGYKKYFPNNKTDVHIIENGIDGNFWRHHPDIIKHEKSFVAVFSSRQFILKGGDLILSLANKFTSCKFYIAGMERPNFITKIDNNITFLGKLPKEGLRDVYSRCQFHLQLSIFEGFGLALCEAMLCKCIPIASSVNILPEIVGDTGFILNKKNIDCLVDMVNDALQAKNKNELGNRARLRILQKYSIQNRTEKLHAVLKMYS